MPGVGSCRAVSDGEETVCPQEPEGEYPDNAREYASCNEPGETGSKCLPDTEGEITLFL